MADEIEDAFQKLARSQVRRQNLWPNSLSSVAFGIKWIQMGIVHWLPLITIYGDTDGYKLIFIAKLDYHRLPTQNRLEDPLSPIVFDVR